MRKWKKYKGTLCRLTPFPKIISLLFWGVLASCIVVSSCSAPAIPLWSKVLINGKEQQTTIETRCGPFSIAKLTEGEGPFFAIRAGSSKVRANHELLKATAFRNGIPLEMHRHEGKDSLNDLAFTTFPGIPGVMFFGFGHTKADSFQIDLWDCFSDRGSYCYDSVVSIAPFVKKK